MYLKGKPLEKVRIKNDIDISNTSDDDFNDIMDKININEDVIFVVLYNPLKYFNNYYIIILLFQYYFFCFKL